MQLLRYITNGCALTSGLLGSGAFLLFQVKFNAQAFFGACFSWNGYEAGTWHCPTVALLFVAATFAVVGSWCWHGRGWGAAVLLSSLAVLGILLAFFAWLEGSHYGPFEQTHSWGRVSSQAKAGGVRLFAGVGTYIQLGCAVCLVVWSAFRLFDRPVQVGTVPAAHPQSRGDA